MVDERCGGPVPGNEVDPSVAVVGAGVMGTNIATLCLGHGLPVTLVDVDEGTLDRAKKVIRDQSRLAQLMASFPVGKTTSELVTTTSLEDVSEASVVLEAVTEATEVKAAVLKKVSEITAPGTPLVSNTSSIPIDELADSVSRPEDLIGAHFMNPAYLIPMVEVVRGSRTGAAAQRTLESLLDQLGRTAVVVRDSPGFVTSRVLHPMINDAIRVVAEGVATPADVDALFEGCLGHRTGPLRTADLIGLDNLADSLRVLHERTSDVGCIPNPLLLKKVSEGDLGQKSGRGFYEYEVALP